MSIEDFAKELYLARHSGTFMIRNSWSDVTQFIRDDYVDYAKRLMERMEVRYKLS